MKSAGWPPLIGLCLVLIRGLLGDVRLNDHTLSIIGAVAAVAVLLLYMSSLSSRRKRSSSSPPRISPPSRAAMIPAPQPPRARGPVPVQPIAPSSRPQRASLNLDGSAFIPLSDAETKRQ